MKSNRSIAVAVVALSMVTLSVRADQIPNRETLEGILGGGGTLEDFETLSVPNGGQRSDSSGYLDSDSIFNGEGPGLVEPGARYSAPSLYWNGNGYFGLITQSLGDCTGWRGYQITIDYDPPITAMGLDLQGYQGYGQDGTISVYDTNGGLISTTDVNGGFFGWEDNGGIGSVVVDTQVNNNYIMIDNHLYGVGGGCVYTLKKSKPKGGCDNCPAKGSDYRTNAECETKKDCNKKVSTTIGCPGGGNGTCKIKGKRSSCG